MFCLSVKWLLFTGMTILTLNFLLQEGEELKTEFLKKARGIPVTTLREEDVAKQIESLKMDLKSKNNSYIEDILARKS